MKYSIKNLNIICRYNILCILIIGMFTPTASATIQDELWQKAVKIAEENIWIPGHVVQHEQVANTKGRIEEDTETHIQLVRGQEGKVVVKILKAVSNGKDVTEEARKEAEGEMELDEIIDSANPFTDVEQDNISVVRLDQDRIIQGRNCVAYQYRLNTLSTVMETEKEMIIEGIAWIDETTGVPYEIQSEIKSVPIKEDKLKINVLKQIDRYAYTEGEWIPVESVVNMDIEFKSFLMKFKGTINSISQYSQHWKL